MIKRHDAGLSDHGRAGAVSLDAVRFPLPRRERKHNGHSG